MDHFSRFQGAWEVTMFDIRNPRHDARIGRRLSQLRQGTGIEQIIHNLSSRPVSRERPISTSVLAQGEQS